MGMTFIGNGNETWAFSGGYGEPDMTDFPKEESVLDAYLRREIENPTFQKIDDINERLEKYLSSNTDFSAQFDSLVGGDKDVGFLVAQKIIKTASLEDENHYNNLDLAIKEKLCKALKDAVSEKSGVQVIPYMRFISDLTGLMAADYIENKEDTLLFKTLNDIYESKADEIPVEKDGFTAKIASDLETIRTKKTG